MKVIMTSSTGSVKKEKGKRLPAPMFSLNGFLEKLQKEWVNDSKVMIIAGTPNDYAKIAAKNGNRQKRVVRFWVRDY